MEIEPFPNLQFLPGFRFHPSDEELIVHYLLNKLKSRPQPVSVIAEIELYNYNPWELPKMALFGEEEWYFYSPRDRKYPNGVRPNRTAASGYWKATGTDKPILSSSASKRIGVKKSLVFYTGRPPKGVKTEWIMNEYRLPDTTTRPSRFKSMRLDDWVLCRVRQKGNMSKNAWEDQYSPSKMVECLPNIKELPAADTDTTTDIISDFNLPKDCPPLATLLAGPNLLPIETILGANFLCSNNCDSVYEDGSSKKNTYLTDSVLESFFNPSKGKPNEENKYESILQFTKKTNTNEHDDLLLGNMLTAKDTNFYNQNWPQGDIFNTNPLIAIMNLQELNDLFFTEKYLEL